MHGQNHIKLVLSDVLRMSKEAVKVWF